MTAIDERDRFRGCLLGLACGDAVGAPIEGWPRGSFPPVVSMSGDVSKGLTPGTWTDDTSMALCLATSLLDSGGFDPKDQMEKYVSWMTKGYMSCVTAGYGIGLTCARSIRTYMETGEALAGPEDPMTAGNGCIMRLAPVPMYFHPELGRVIRYSAESSRTTNATRECVDACRLFGSMIAAALGGAEREEILFENYYRSQPSDALSEKIGYIAQGVYRHKKESEIKGTGYVVESLEAALWCFLHSDTFEESILKAVNLGDDTDTTAAVCGQLAGAYYGETGVPDKWLETVVMGDDIGRLAEMLMRLEAKQESD